MKWVAIAVLLLVGCGKPSNTMKDVAARIREGLIADNLEELCKAAKVSCDRTETVRRREWFRIPADDGFVWVEVPSPDGPACSFKVSSIQFSQSGKLESP